MGSDDTRAEGVRCCDEYIQEMKRQNKIADPCAQWLVVTKLKYLCTQDDYSAVKECAESMQANYPLSELAREAMAGLVVWFAAKEEDIGTVATYAELYREMYLWLRKHPEEKPRQVQLDLTDYDTEEYASQVFWKGAIAFNTKEEYETAYLFWKELPWEADNFDGSCFSGELLKTLERIPDKEPLIQYCRKFYKEQYFRPEYRSYLPKACREAL